MQFCAISYWEYCIPERSGEAILYWPSPKKTRQIISRKEVLKLSFLIRIWFYDLKPDSADFQSMPFTIVFQPNLLKILFITEKQLATKQKTGFSKPYYRSRLCFTISELSGRFDNFWKVVKSLIFKLSFLYKNTNF